MEDVILTPIYKGVVYKYHECSNCKGKTYFEEDFFIPFYFKEKIKYCPFCGKKIIRYGQPEYEELPNWDWLDEYTNIIDKAYRYLKYKIHCKLKEEEKRELKEKAEFGKEYFGVERYNPTSRGNVCELICNISREKIHYTTKNKLEKEFKGE